MEYPCSVHYNSVLFMVCFVTIESHGLHIVKMINNLYLRQNFANPAILHPFFFLSMQKLYSTFYLGIGDHSIERFAIVFYFLGCLYGQNLLTFYWNLKRVTALCSRFRLSSLLFENIYFLHKIHQYSPVTTI